MIYSGVAEHIYFKSGEAKTVCTSEVLGAFGIHPSQYHYSGHANQRANVLRKHGWAVRSRFSQLRRNASVGQARQTIINLNDPTGTHYMVTVERHCLLLDENGNTIVDTAPRKRDRRKVKAIHAVFPKRSEAQAF